MVREQYSLQDIAQIGSLRNIPEAERLTWNVDEKLKEMLNASTSNFMKLVRYSFEQYILYIIFILSLFFLLFGFISKFISE